MTQLMYQVYMNDDEAVEAVQTINKTVHTDQIYIITHDDDHTNRVAKRANANTIGAQETGFGEQLKNAFRKKGDELRTQLQELGFGESESEGMEDKLDKGAVIVIVQDPPAGFSM